MQIIMQFIVCFRWKIRGANVSNSSKRFVASVQTVAKTVKKVQLAWKIMNASFLML